MATSEKVLSVDSLEGYNATKNRVLLAPSVMVELGVGIGDVIQLKQVDSQESTSRGRSKTSTRDLSSSKPRFTPIAFGIAWPSPTCSHNKTEISAITRSNCGVAIGEAVVISKLQSFNVLLEASRIVLSPVALDTDSANSKSHQSQDDVLEIFLQQHLVGQYVCEGYEVVLSVYGRKRKFVVRQLNSIPHSSAVLENSKDLDELKGVMPIYKVKLSTQIVISSDEKKSPLDMAHGSESTENLDYSKVGGLKKQIEELRELVELPLKNPGLFSKFGVKPPCGVLLYGPPGTGKTLLAKVLAQVTGASCFTLSAPEIMSKYYGESEARLREIFETARAKAPSIIFIDEIDAIAPKRDSSDSEVSKRIVGTLLTLMDGMDSNKPNKQNEARVVVLAASNRPNALDPALRRPGRFDREIEIPIPNETGRLEILQVYFNKMQHKLSSDDILKIASVTHGYVGADLSNLCKEAALHAFKRIYHQARTEAVEFKDSDLYITLNDVSTAMTEIRPSAMREVMVDIPNIKWEDIGGYEEVKEKLKQAVEWPLQHPEAFKRLNITPTRGVLLYGPPGCSKTLLAKAVASQAGLNFIPIKGPELFSKYVGESEKAVREVFRKARAASPSIVFFDEIDAIGAERGQSSDSTSVHDRVLAQMLNELDGIEPLKSVLFLAATNRPDIIDKALMRPGRIDQAIYISPPDAAARKRIFEINLKKIPHQDDLDVDELVNLSQGLSGAEITAACREAGLAAMAEDIENVSIVQNKHFTMAVQSIVPTITDSMIQFYTNFAKQQK